MSGVTIHVHGQDVVHVVGLKVGQGCGLRPVVEGGAEGVEWICM